VGEAHDGQFVDKDSATIGHNQETVIEDDSNHRDLCMISGGSGTLNKVFDFLHPALDDTRKAIAKDSPRCEYMTPCWECAHKILDARPSVFDESTVREQSSDEESPVETAIKSVSGQLRCYMWSTYVCLLISP
jgi:hypothetical protein